MSVGERHRSQSLQGAPRVSAHPYQIRVSSLPEDPAWDAFLAQARGGHHSQTSLWARLKAPDGWQADRVLVTQQDSIVAGAQLLSRPVPLAGLVGYVTRGPVLASDEPVLPATVVQAVHEVARRRGIRYLAVQPPQHGEVVEQQLLGSGFRPSALQVASPATVQLDLSQSSEVLLSRMHPKTRYNIRLARRKAIVVREGGETDLEVFYRLLVITGQRHQFSLYSERYFARMWQLLSPGGHIKLFVAEYAGEPVSALLAIAFGDTVCYKRGAWSGQHGDRHPNELMQWTAITWAKAMGYHYYDFDDIELSVARAILSGDNSARRSVTAFKVGFCDQITLLPRTHDYVYNGPLRWTYSRVYPRIARWPVVAKLINALRSS